MPDDWEQKGDFLAAGGRFDLAVNAYAQAVSVARNPNAVRAKMARAHMLAGNLVTARELFEAQLTENPGDPSVLTGCAELAIAMGNDPAATTYLQQVASGLRVQRDGLAARLADISLSLLSRQPVAANEMATFPALQEQDAVLMDIKDRSAMLALLRTQAITISQLKAALDLLTATGQN
ncbi:tetratricopeptide repeat protein [Asticcacaulis sp.]|uniref:tetratricopeptide repeat protein n=1 Tax=Asticcacaulis sp. TaxID=1872648 RepID=UPI0026369A45|nr:tetratricopeptide repeat protein [Asticcacaulis sp.]